LADGVRNDGVDTLSGTFEPKMRRTEERMADRWHRREMLQAGLASAAALLTAEAMSDAWAQEKLSR
jgi:hypothetical protein